MTYSSARFADPGQPLEAGAGSQARGDARRGPATVPGDTILEIGCGWGPFAELAARAGRHVHGITLSREQKAFAEARMARRAWMAPRFALTDYRDVSRHYDAVVSIEMVEAVGRNIGRTISRRSPAR